jgi:hypothetical protein
METGRIALILFYGIFWASVLNAVTRYRPFDTTEFFSQVEKRRKIVWHRFLVSLLFLNICPIFWLWLLYYWVVPNTSGILPVIVAAFASLSVFGFNRIFHAVIATPKTWHIFYPSKEDYEEVIKKWGGKINTFKAHFIPGLVYLLGFMIIAKIIGCLWIIYLHFT